MHYQVNTNCTTQSHHASRLRNTDSESKPVCGRPPCEALRASPARRHTWCLPLSLSQWEARRGGGVLPLSGVSHSASRCVSQTPTGDALGVSHCVSRSKLGKGSARPAPSEESDRPVPSGRRGLGKGPKSGIEGNNTLSFGASVSCYRVAIIRNESLSGASLY